MKEKQIGRFAIRDLTPPKSDIQHIGRFEVRDLKTSPKSGPKSGHKLSPKSDIQYKGRFEIKDLKSSSNLKQKSNKSSPKSGVKRIGRFEVRDISPIKNNIGKLKITNLPNSGSKKCFKVCL